MLTNLQAASYGSSPNSTPFLAYFEATTPASPAKHARLRTALFLQTSSAYDASAAGARLAPHAPLLAPELAIIAGKVCERSHSQLVPPPPLPSLHSHSKKKIKKRPQLGDAHEALSLLVRTVHDYTSAAAFCTSNGAVVPPRAAAHLAERAGLAALVPPPPPPTSDVPTDSTETKRLLHLLLTIYTSDTTYVSSRSEPPIPSRHIYRISPHTFPFFFLCQYLPPLHGCTPSTPSPFRSRSGAPALLARHFF